MSSNTNDQGTHGLSDIGNSPSSQTDNNDNNSDRFTPWTQTIETSIARSRKIRGGNYVQIATVDPHTQEPRCRTVVFRGFLSHPQKNDDKFDTLKMMKMITDQRSKKVEEITTNQENPIAEMVWWFSKSSEQYRICGKLVFVGEDDKEKDEFLFNARKQQWGNLSDSAREQFFWKDPGAPYEPQAIVPPGGRDENGKLLPPPKSFLLMLLYPYRVDYLRLGDNYRQEDEFDGEKWVPKRVNP